MRRMRDWTVGHYVIAAIPFLAAGFAIYHFAGPRRPASADGEDGLAIKPSQYGRANRKIALAKDNERTRNSGTMVERAELESIRRAGDESDAGEHKRESKDRGREKRDSRKPSSELEGASGESNHVATIGTECRPLEYRGQGPVATKVTKGEWMTVMEQFHGAKHALLGWIETKRHEMPEATAKALERQVRNLKIQRPPASDQPDLAWRGIGVYSQGADGEPMVVLGGGFLPLAIRHPARAKFEITRLVAQSLGPCELKRIGAGEAVWAPLLKCVGMNEAQDCALGSYSEGGWAVSTTLAAAVTAPGCQVAAFKEPEMADCLKRFPLSKTVAKSGGASQSDELVTALSAPAWGAVSDKGASR